MAAVSALTLSSSEGVEGEYKAASLVCGPEL
jgi:hypothetical protein